MTNIDKKLWTFWWIILIFVSLSTMLYLIAAHTKKVELVLEKDEKVDIELFRFLPQNISMEIGFSEKIGVRRPELGNYKMRTGWEKTRTLDFLNPGEPVKLLVGNSKEHYMYEAKPAGSHSIDTAWRSLVPYNNDNSPNQFIMDFGKKQKFLLDAGFNEFQVTIFEAGKSLSGEHVTLYINPPISFKFGSSEPLYEFLWYFNFWPIYYLILFVWFLVLLIRRRLKKHVLH